MDIKNMLFYEAARLVVGPLADWHYHINVEGQDNVPESGAALIVCNHRSLLDPVVVGYSVDRFINFAAASYTFKMPVVKQLYTWAGGFPLSIYGGSESDKDINMAESLLENGELVGIFPEGVQSFFNPHRVTKIATFKTGFAKLALEARVPIVPCTVIAQEERELPKIPGFLVTPFVKLPDAGEGVRFVTYRNVTCRIGRPIDLSPYYDEQYTKALIDRIAGRIRRIIIKLYDGEGLDRYLTGEKPFDFVNDRV
ncbi:MAG: 1-acyl-sn-glycerol-3-phosphate acyltransferase [Actinomycetia bacterium]|nr:1-acyl-sn-glycerol-3-phosphate acyltransferase [Actinomycetota bacterium]MBU4301938.1 1-acyl-sn-glycerol-3-phosphate acyltransferase [Actinomycetota bacterium]MCG2796701.1 1-acyl-sn-glycerol-3-phosphate acyltransferase [Actinomycetes bacterium]